MNVCIVTVPALNKGAFRADSRTKGIKANGDLRGVPPSLDLPDQSGGGHTIEVNKGTTVYKLGKNVQVSLPSLQPWPNQDAQLACQIQSDREWSARTRNAPIMVLHTASLRSQTIPTQVVLHGTFLPGWSRPPNDTSFMGCTWSRDQLLSWVSLIRLQCYIYRPDSAASGANSGWHFWLGIGGGILGAVCGCHVGDIIQQVKNEGSHDSLKLLLGLYKLELQVKQQEDDAIDIAMRIDRLETLDRVPRDLNVQVILIFMHWIHKCCVQYVP